MKKAILHKKKNPTKIKNIKKKKNEYLDTSSTEEEECLSDTSDQAVDADLCKPICINSWVIVAFSTKKKKQFDIT